MNPASDSPSNDSAIQACLQGDEDAWRALVHRYRRLVYSISIACGLKQPAAEDVFQDVILKLWRHLDKIRNPDGLASWIAVTTKRECFVARSRARRQVSLDQSTVESKVSPSEELEARLVRIEAQHALSVAFEKLDATCRDLLHATFVEDPAPGYQEIARRLKRPVGSLGPTRGRCLEKLRALYLRESGENR